MSKLKIVGDTACPECTARGGDRTGNHMLIFENKEGERFGKCTRGSCGFYIAPKDFDPDKYKAAKRTEKTPEQCDAELAELLDCPFKKLESRNIKEAVCERFGVRVGLDPVNGQEVTTHLYPKYRDGKLVSYKLRNLVPKFFYSLGHKATDCDLFGLEQAKKSDVGNQYLWVVEDELSAMSCYQVLDEYSKTTNKPAVVGLPDGTGSISRALGEQLDWVNTFKNVVFVMDGDKAGKKAVEEGLKLVPHALVVELPPLKNKKEGVDPNDYLMNGKGRELFNFLLFRQEAPKIEGLVSVLDCLDEALEPPEYGASSPWPELDKLTFGQRTKEIVAVGGGVGCGKTLMAHMLAAWNWEQHGRAGFCVMLEENNGDTVKNIAGKIDEVPYHRPDFDFDVEKLRGTATKLNDGVHLWKSSINQNIRYNFDKIEQAIRYHAAVNNIKDVYFDNITAATQHLTPSEINTEVGRIAMTLAGLADELDLQIFIFSHLNTPSSGPSHEEGGEVKEFQFTGSRALMRWCQVIIGFERNKQAEGDTKHESRIRLLKQRKYGTTGVVDTQYVPSTGMLIERPKVEEKNEEF